MNVFEEWRIKTHTEKKTIPCLLTILLMSTMKLVSPDIFPRPLNYASQSHLAFAFPFPSARKMSRLTLKKLEGYNKFHLFPLKRNARHI